MDDGFCLDGSMFYMFLNIPAAAFSKPPKEAWAILEIPKEMELCY